MSHVANDRKVLVIGWDAADWRVIEPMLAEGKLPNLKKLMDEGVHGNNSTLYPVLSPMLWTSIATGKRPFKHGIHGFSEPTPDGTGVRPITNISRETKAIWNILQQCGKRSIVVGWWPSHPAEPIDGVMVSNHFQRAGGLRNTKVDPENGKPRSGDFGWSLDQWPMSPGTVHPPEMAKNLQEFRFHPLELEYEHVAPFIPKIAGIDPSKDKRLEGFAKTLADTVSIQGVSTALQQLEQWDLMCVYFDGIDHFCHGFMKYHPPRQEFVSEEDFENYKGVVEGAYRFHDMMLGATLQLAGEDTTVILLSDHGFHPDHLRPQHIPTEPAGPAIEHRPYGIFVMKGPGIRRGERLNGASVLDLCPTVLALFGLPVGLDMDGKALVSAFEDPVEVGTIESWDAVEGDCGMHPPDARLDAMESAEAIKQLVDLGYIDEPDKDVGVAVRDTVKELKYNLARAYMDASLYHEAIPLLEEIWKNAPAEHRFGLKLVTCLEATGQLKDRARVIEVLHENVREHQLLALDEFPEIRDEAARYGVFLAIPELREHSNGVTSIIWTPSDEKADPDATYEEMPKKLANRIRTRTTLISPMHDVFNWLHASQALLGDDPEQAKPFLTEMAKIELNHPDLHLQVGAGFLQLKLHEDALQAYNRALAADSENAAAHQGIAKAALALGDAEAAVDHALHATELLFFNPQSHLILGRGLARLGNREMAQAALDVALRQAPGYREAHLQMAELLETHFDDPEGGKAHRAAAEAARHAAAISREDAELEMGRLMKDIADRRSRRKSAAGNLQDWGTVPTDEIITIVSGLPRSGTSMMMQCLNLGGLTPFTDGERSADSDNPRGYFEHQKATQLGRDRSWLDQVRGKSVKIMAQLLPMLPPDQKYRILFMDRDLQEIARSQRAMLDRLGNPGSGQSDVRLIRTFDAQVAAVEAWMAEASNVQCLFIDYVRALGEPSSVMHEVNRFLGGSLDEGSMISAIDPSLRRQDASGNTAG